MARHRKIDVRIHGDEKFCRLSSPPPGGKYLWFYLLTNPDTVNIPGLYRAGEAQLAEGLEWPVEGFREAFAELSREGMAKADWKARLVWVPNAIIYNPPANPNVVKSWRVMWDEIPECPLKVEARQWLKVFLEPYGKGFQEAFEKACPNRSGNGMANQEQEQEQEQEQKEEKDCPPTCADAQSVAPTVEPSLLAPQDENGNGHPPKAPIDSKLCAWLQATKNFKPLADPKHGDFWKTIEAAYDSYPFLFFEDELKKADAWIEANPRRRPRDFRKFFQNWLNVAVDKGRREEARNAQVTRFAGNRGRR